MSVTFSPSNQDGSPMARCDCDDMTCVACTSSLNVANDNAIDLLRWLGFPVKGDSELYGSAPASDIEARCRRRLWPEARNEDPELPGYVERAPGAATLINCGRRPGYLREKTERLLAMATEARAADSGAVIGWG